MKILTGFDGRELTESELLLVRGGVSQGPPGDAKFKKKKHDDRDKDRNYWHERDYWGGDDEDSGYYGYYRGWGGDDYFDCY